MSVLFPNPITNTNSDPTLTSTLDLTPSIHEFRSEALSLNTGSLINQHSPTLPAMVHAHLVQGYESCVH